MAEHIEREAVIKTIDGVSSLSFTRASTVESLNQIPAADVVEVVHGEWVLIDECSNEGLYCSACHKKVYKECYANCKPQSNYCPNCGAKMDGERKETE